MSLNNNTKIVAIVGLTGSGKSAVVDYIIEKGYPKVYFGGVIYEAMAEAGIPQGEANEKVFRVDIREREGKDFVVKRINQQIHNLINAGQHRIVADGVYSWDEYKIMKHEFPGELEVIAVVAQKRIRHKRLTTRTERPLTLEEANSRDWSEIEDIQKGGPIAIADHFVINDGSMEDMYEQVDKILREIKFID
jgi:dephospho-CoA kinase